MLHVERIVCPYCGERLEITLDTSCGGQDYVEDCQVCCRPMEISLRLDDALGRIAVSVRRDDE